MGIFSFRKRTEAVGLPGVTGIGTRLMRTDTTALSSAAHWSCITLLCGKMATLPFTAHKEGTTRELGKANVLTGLIDRPNRFMTHYQFFYIMEFNFEEHGVAIAVKEYSSNGRVIALYPVSPSTMTAYWTDNGDLRFRCSTNGKDYAREDLLVIWNTPVGYDTALSPLQFAQDDIDLTTEAKKLQKEYYKGGAVLGRLIKVPNSTYDKTKEQIKAVFDSAIGYRNMIIPDSVSVEPIRVEGEDIAKLIEAQAWDVKEVARRFHVPVSFLGDTSGGYGTQEQQAIQLVTECLQPRCKAWEIAWNNDVCASDEYVKFELQSLMRGDHATRQAWYTAMLTHGVMSVNEVRDLEDMEPIGKEGDVHYFQSGFASLKDIANGAFTKAGATTTEPTQNESSVDPTLLDITEKTRFVFANGTEEKSIVNRIRYVADKLGLDDEEWLGEYVRATLSRKANWNAENEAYRCTNAILVRKCMKEGARYTLNGREPGKDGKFEEDGKKFRNPPTKLGDKRIITVEVK